LDTPEYDEYFEEDIFDDNFGHGIQGVIYKKLDFYTWHLFAMEKIIRKKPETN